MGRRAEQVDDTRKRIVEAAVELHGTVGPASSSVSAIAERAGVTRLTVYRHFPDEQALFAACSSHWLAARVTPDPESWAAVDDPADRLRTGLADLYRYYREGEPMLTNIYRDKAAIPPAHRAGIEQRDAAFADLLAQALPGPPARRRLLRALVGHATAFATWRSLCVDQALSDDQAVRAMTALVLHHADAT